MRYPFRCTRSPVGLPHIESEAGPPCHLLTLAGAGAPLHDDIRGFPTQPHVWITYTPVIGAGLSLKTLALT